MAARAVVGKRWTWIVLMLLSVVGLGLAACGGGDDGESTAAAEALGVPGVTVYTVGPDLVV